MVDGEEAEAGEMEEAERGWGPGVEGDCDNMVWMCTCVCVCKWCRSCVSVVELVVSSDK